MEQLSNDFGESIPMSCRDWASMKAAYRFFSNKNLSENQFLEGYFQSTMGDIGACWDNAVVGRFFGSLKHDWIFKIDQPTRKHMAKDVAAFMRYYNLERLHTANGDQSPIHYENALTKVSGMT